MVNVFVIEGNKVLVKETDMRDENGRAYLVSVRGYGTSIISPSWSERSVSEEFRQREAAFEGYLLSKIRG